MIISVGNQKGGVGKTTTTMNLAAGLSQIGKSVLCIDFDPQCHLSKYIGHIFDDDPTITDCLFAKASYQMIPVNGLIRHSRFERIDYIPASLRLSKADLVLAQAMFRERVLADVLGQLDLSSYDFVLIDCNPSMGILLTNALIASDGIVIPVQTEDFAVDGLEDMLEMIALMREQGNPKLQILGLLPTMMTHTNSSRQIVALLHDKYTELTMENGISRSVDATNSTKRKAPLVGTKSKLGNQYYNFTVELLQRIRLREEA